ncbi:hypothetical protein Lser_V15G38280 [Lactuca serriola]
MTTEVGENIILYKTAQEIWEAAKETYSSTENSSELFKFETKLYDLRQGDLSVTQYFHLLSRIWLQLDLFETHPWKCVDDDASYRSVVNQKRTIRFLLGLNKDLDGVRSQVMGTHPLPTSREAFSTVRQEESRKKLMMPQSNNLITEGSALFTNTSTHHGKSQKSQGRPWCEHCKVPGHWKHGCWKLHGKPADWKPSSARFNKENRANLTTYPEPYNNEIQTIKNQLEALTKMMQNNSTSDPNTTGTTEQSTSLLVHKGKIIYALHTSYGNGNAT